MNEYRITHFVRITYADGNQTVVPVMAATALEAAQIVCQYRIILFREVEVWEAGAGPFCYAPGPPEPVKAP